MKDMKTTTYYQTQYDNYWASEDRIGESSGDLDSIARQIITSCGLGRTLDIGSGEGLLVSSLLHRGVDAHGLDVSEIVTARCNERLPGRFTHGSVLELPFANESFQTVVSTDCLEHLAPDDVPKALKEIHRVAGRYAFFQIATTPDRDGHWHLTIEGRAWWEEKCFEAGFRKHPLYYRINAYEALNTDNWQICILLEKVPSKALKQFDLNTLAEERLLHNDMLRETGRRSDAHCIRYHKAAQLIRPGDRVLDIACGLGYGSHILFSASQASSVLGIDSSEFGINYANAHYKYKNLIEFSCGDAQHLSDIPDHSIDFVAAFETIEHLEDPLAYLHELKRVLKPAGRIMVCAPNNWVDETGKDPNPHHLHVYTWERLVSEVKSFFLLEQGIFQTAGGALKCPDANRGWIEFPVGNPPKTDSEWILLVAMSDPLGGKNIPYKETIWELPKSPDFHVAAFARDYENPWLIKGMIAIGLRIRAKQELVRMQEHVLSSEKQESADYGAALCGHIYSCIEGNSYSSINIDYIESEVLRFASIPEPSPHQIRWQISILFSAGELARKQGRFNDAVKFYAECASRDALPYSPLLGNKTLDSLFWLSLFSLNNNDKASAKKYLVQSIHETKRLMNGEWLNIVGSFDEPIPFGFAETSQLFDKAARAAYMLAAIQKLDNRPFLVAQEATGFFERNINHYEDQLSVLASQTKPLVEPITTPSNVKDENEALHRMLTHARSNLQLIEQSRSWKITKPLRLASTLGRTLLWYLARFESTRKNFGLNIAVYRSIKHLQSRHPSPTCFIKNKFEQGLISPIKNNDYKQEAHTYKSFTEKRMTPTQKKPPIFMLVDSFHDGGVERVVIDLCIQFEKSGRPGIILVANNGGRSAAEARSHGIEVIEFNLNRSNLNKFILSNKCDIVFTHHCYFSLDLFHNEGASIIEVLHNAYHWQKGNIQTANIRNRFIPRFIAVSDFVRNFSITELKIEKDRISLINNGLNNIDLIRPPTILLQSARLKTYKEPILLHVANLHPQKNHRLIVNAFARIKLAFPKAKLIMAGAMDNHPELYKALIDDIEKLGVAEAVVLSGALDRRKLSKAMASAHIGLLPSILEGFSIATLEFSFFGLPSVLSQTGAAHELKQAYGHIEMAAGAALPQHQLSVDAIESALKIIPENAIDSLVASIVKILENYPQYLEKALSAAAAFPDYSIERTARKYEQLIQALETTGAHS